MPVGPGLWPAFWLLGNDIGTIGGTYPAGVNGATQSFYGVPQATADLVTRTPQVFEVDWVRAYGCSGRNHCCGGARLFDATSRVTWRV